MSKAAELAALIANVNNGSSLANKNLIINGAMNVSQRGTSSTGITASGYRQAPDRFRPSIGTAGTWTMSQSTDVPTGEGFAHSYKFDCTTADASLAVGDDMALQYRFEGQDVQMLKKGTSSAVPVTVSFWVKSTKTGTFILELMDNDNAREISKSYTVSSSNTWEYKTVTFEGDTTGALDDDNARSLTLQWWLVAGTNWTSGTLNTSWSDPATANRVVGQVNIADSTSNDWLLTGVQMEIGEKATEFEHEPYGTTLKKCQRYYHEHIRGVSGTRKYVGTGDFYVTTQLNCNISFPTTMRTSPTLVQGNGTDYFGWWGGSQAGDISATWNLFLPSENTTSMYLNADDDPSASGIGARIYIKDDASTSGTTNAFLAFNAEL